MGRYDDKLFALALRKVKGVNMLKMHISLVIMVNVLNAYLTMAFSISLNIHESNIQREPLRKYDVV